MKKAIRLVVSSVAVIACLQTAAFGQWADSPEDSLFTVENLDWLSLSVSIEDVERELIGSDIANQNMETRNAYLLVSGDILRWLTVNAGAGYSEISRMDEDDYFDAENLWTLGIRANLLDHEIKSPSFMVSRLQIYATASYWDMTEADFDGGSIGYNEKRAALIFSAERFVVHPGSDHSIYPYSLVFFIGPVYSDLEFDGSGVVPVGTSTTSVSSLDGEKELGLIGGLDLFISHNLSLGWEARVFSEMTHKVKLAYHF